MSKLRQTRRRGGRRTRHAGRRTRHAGRRTRYAGRRTRYAGRRTRYAGRRTHRHSRGGLRWPWSKEKKSSDQRGDIELTSTVYGTRASPTNTDGRSENEDAEEYDMLNDARKKRMVRQKAQQNQDRAAGII